MKLLPSAALALLSSNAAFALPANNETEDPAAPSLVTLTLSDDVTVKVGGRTHLDWTWATGDDAYDTDDGVEFRRVRLHAAGTLFDLIDYKTEFDFAGGDADFRSVYMGIKDTPIGDVKVGHFKEPFSLEQLTSSRFITFAERSLADALTPMFNTGIQLSDSFGDTDFNWAFGVFRDTGSAGNDNTGDEPDAETDAEYAFTARAAGTVAESEDGSDLLHLGVAYSLREPDDGSVGFSSRPEAHLMNSVASSGTIAADQVHLGGLEAAWVGGPASIQGEYIMASVDGESGADDADYMGYYVEGSYFLTDESRHYSASSNSFSRVTPNDNVTREGGKGAHQLALRYSMLDLDDGPSTDELSGITLGWNWYLNPYTAVKLNYIHSEFDDGSVDDSADIFIIRFQFDF